MEYGDIEKYLGKKVIMYTRNGWTYHGKIISLRTNNLTFLDKFSQKSEIEISHILSIGETGWGCQDGYDKIY